MDLNRGSDRHGVHGRRPVGAQRGAHAGGLSEEARKYARHNAKYTASHAATGLALWKKALVGVVAAIVLVGGATAAYASWYMHRIDQALSIKGEDLEAVSQVTEQTNLNEPFYMLIMGSDARVDEGVREKDSESSSGERSDVIILARIDAPNRKVTLVSVPRDTFYTLENGETVKINETYSIGGAAYTIKAVEDVTGVNISHFAELRFSDLENMVDALGGVTVTVDVPLSYKDALTGEVVHIDAGEQTLSGQQAQIFVRACHEYATDQDVHRQNNVRQLATAMMKAVLDRPITQIPDTVLELAQYIHTDLKASDIIQLARMFSGGELTVYSCTGPNLGDFYEECDGKWLCYPNPEGWAALIAAVDAGEDPSGIDVNSMVEKPETAGESQTEGTSEPEVNDEGEYVPQDYQDDEGGYVEPFGTYYYEEPYYPNTNDTATATTEGDSAPANTGDDGGDGEASGETGGEGEGPVDAGGDTSTADAGDGGGGGGGEAASVSDAVSE